MYADKQDALDEPPIKCINEDCESMRIEYENLKNEHFLQQTNHQVEISKMDVKIDKLKSIIKNQSATINRLNHQVTRNEKSKNSLSLLVQGLKQQNLLSEEAVHALNVCIFSIMIKNYALKRYQMHKNDKNH